MTVVDCHRSEARIFCTYLLGERCRRLTTAARRFNSGMRMSKAV